MELVSVDEPEYDRAREDWAPGPRSVLGQVGGRPAWLQGDEIPSCPSCRERMDFVLPMEEGHDDRTAANFGGGSAFAFACADCDEAAFLWQQ